MLYCGSKGSQVSVACMVFWTQAMQEQKIVHGLQFLWQTCIIVGFNSATDVTAQLLT